MNRYSDQLIFDRQQQATTGEQDRRRQVNKTGEQNRRRQVNKTDERQAKIKLQFTLYKF